MAVCQKEKWKMIRHQSLHTDLQSLPRRQSADWSLLFNDPIDVRQCLVQRAIFIYQLKMQQLPLLRIKSQSSNKARASAPKYTKRHFWVLLERIWAFPNLPWSDGCSCQLYKPQGAFSWSICKEGRKGMFFLCSSPAGNMSTVHRANQSSGEQQGFQGQTREGVRIKGLVPFSQS